VIERLVPRYRRTNFVDGQVLGGYHGQRHRITRVKIFPSLTGVPTRTPDGLVKNDELDQETISPTVLFSEESFET
jgi:hypothetical protein